MAESASYIVKAETCQILSLGENTRWSLSVAKVLCTLILAHCGGTPHIPILDILSDGQTRVGTPHRILRCFRSIGGGHRTFQLRLSCQIFKLGWGHRTNLELKH